MDKTVNYKILEDLPFPTFFPEENFSLMKNLPLGDNDIVVTAYPKCGLNWVSYIIYGIFHPEDPPADAKSVQDFCVFVDYYGISAWKGNADGAGRTMSTHLPFNYLQWNSSTKFVAVIRNPMDICVSFYLFLKSMHKDVKVDDSQQKIPDQFFTFFMNGAVSYGDYFKHLKTLHQRKSEDNVHIVVYEKLKANPREEILNLARFLERAEKLEANNCELLDKLVEQTSFHSMKKNVHYKGPGGRQKQLLRKGEVGGYKQSLTSDQITALREKLEKEMTGTEFLDLWRNV